MASESGIGTCANRSVRAQETENGSETRTAGGRRQNAGRSGLGQGTSSLDRPVRQDPAFQSGA
jgi:hypothetical protein